MESAQACSGLRWFWPRKSRVRETLLPGGWVAEELILALPGAVSDLRLGAAAGSQALAQPAPGGRKVGPAVGWAQRASAPAPSSVVRAPLPESPWGS